MSEKIYVLDGALLACDQGFMPAPLQVTENTKIKIQGKLKATDMDVQVPQTFGQCRLKPTLLSFLPCTPALQKWTKTADKMSFGGKKFLYEDSECMCATGGKIAITKPMQVNIAGAATAELQSIAQIIPGAMLGNDKIPKIVESYWVNEAADEEINEIMYGEKAKLFVKTENFEAGEVLTVNIKDSNNQKIDGKQRVFVFSGKILADDTAELMLLETKEEWGVH